jgi:hypothetical protein
MMPVPASHHPQPFVAAVRDVKIPGVVEINGVGTAKLRAGGGTAVSRKAWNPGTGDDPHTAAVRIDSDHPVALSLGNVEGWSGPVARPRGNLRLSAWPTAGAAARSQEIISGLIASASPGSLLVETAHGLSQCLTPPCPLQVRALS